jgi:imidazolonepropionase-like amidohydrolase
VIQDGKISAIGVASQIAVPQGFKVLEAAVVTPGLVDAHGTVGFSGILNQPHDQDQLEHSAPLQPELRAIDAFNAKEDLLEWVRGFGVTTVHAGHAPGELISGQTLVAKTAGRTAADAVIVESASVAATLGSAGLKTDSKSPGTRGKSIAMLRSELIKAREYLDKQKRAAAAGDKGEPPPRDLRLETLGRVLGGELPLLVTTQRSQDIASALRLADEFKIKLWLDGADEAYLLVDEIKAAGVPVILHPTMTRSFGEHENLSMETAAKLVAAGIPLALQSGYESYVPKTRVVLFEAAVAAANGLSFDQALRTITIDAARILGIDKRVGSLEVGKDGDVALYDGDPFEYTTHCIGTVIEGRVVSDAAR